MTKKLLVLGAGGHGRVAADAAKEAGLWREIAFLDDRWPELEFSGAWGVLERLDQWPRFVREGWDILPGIGDNALRSELCAALREQGASLPSVVHPRGWVSSGASFGGGCVFFAQTAVNTGACIGDGCIINTGATVDHDCVLAGGVHLSPGVHLAGNVCVEACAWIGTGASVIPGITVGARAVVGAGAVVIADVPPGVCAVGVPAKALPSSAREGTE